MRMNHASTTLIQVDFIKPEPLETNVHHQLASYNFYALQRRGKRLAAWRADTAYHCSPMSASQRVEEPS
jgi:hypothetical protein